MGSDAPKDDSDTDIPKFNPKIVSVDGIFFFSDCGIFVASFAEYFIIKFDLPTGYDPDTERMRPRTSKIPKYIETTPPKSFVYTINSISFSPVAPHDFAAVHSATVSIFSGQTLDHRSTISDFSDTVASASFRGDRKLLTVGDLTGIVDMFAALDLEPSIFYRR
ncbi:U3 small nucleolar RNA-associated protein 15 [Striga asiatica]|uniref:U3 small nucleolar RNA-associated protein 15 n=1 Tax=Striga asiatica TaxID=4170 RepID=A0A5A7PKJ0_STRAF|nr:U3 small nucleolar RNA-associated protein 15 [Striga asiatica]